MAKSRNKRQATSENVYVLTVYLLDHYMLKKYLKRFPKDLVSRTIEMRGDQTLEELHNIIFEALDREDEHLFEFEFGSKPGERGAPKYTPIPDGDEDVDASATSLDDLGLKPKRVFGYLFDFGDSWYHQIHVDRIETVTQGAKYPRIIERRHKSPPQYELEDEDDE